MITLPGNMGGDARQPGQLTLAFQAGEFAICRLEADEPEPAWAKRRGGFHSVTRTPGELSVICDQRDVPGDVKCTRGWRLARIEGTFPHDATGILAAVVTPLAEAGVSVFASATFDTDYILVSSAQLQPAVRTLTAAGHTVRDA